MKKFLKAIKLIAINLAILFTLLLIIDPFLEEETMDDSKGKTFRSLNLREFGPNKNFTLDGTTFPDTQDDTLDHQFYALRTDNLGFIVGPADDLTSVPDVIFYGGSTTECMFVDDSLRFPYLVEQKLQKSLNPNLIVRNAGFGGNHSMHSLINFIGNGLVYKPKLVVLMHNSNDLSQLSKTGSYWNAPPNRALLKKEFVPSHPSWKAKFQNFKSAFMALVIPNISKKLYQLKRSQKAGEDEWKGMRSGEFVGFEVVESQFRSSIETFVKTAKSHNIPVVLMTQFNRVNLKDGKVNVSFTQFKNPILFEEYVQFYDRFNDVIREVAKEENIFLIDLDKTIPPTKQYLIDAVHLNNAGSRFVSEIVSDSISSFLRQIDSTKSAH